MAVEVAVEVAAAAVAEVAAAAAVVAAAATSWSSTASFLGNMTSTSLFTWRIFEEPRNSFESTGSKLVVRGYESSAP